MGSGIFALSTRAMFANQAMLDTTAHNISNVNTPGYSRQKVELSTDGGMFTGAGFFGRGVKVTTVTRATNDFLIKSANEAAAGAAADKTRLDKLEQLESTLPIGETGLGYAATQLLNAFVDVANQPQDMSARQVVLSRAEEWASRVRSSAQQIEQLQSGVIADMGTNIKQVNDYAQQIAKLNQDIASARGTGQPPNDLMDSRDELIGRLNKIAQVNTIEADDGSLSVFLGGGQLLVLSNQAQQLALMQGTNADGITVGRVGIITANSVRQLDDSQLAGGALRGLMDFQDKDLAATRKDLDDFVSGFTNAINTQQQLGITAKKDAAGNIIPGASLFADNGKALTVRVALQNPQDIAAASPLVAFTADTNKGTMAVDSVTMNAPAGRALPATPLNLTFNTAASGSGFDVVDGGGNVVASGWQPGQPLVYKDAGGVALFTQRISGVPEAGDSITLEPPIDPAGNNGNARAMLSLRDQNIITLTSNGSTASVTSAYSEMVGNLGVRVQSGKTASGISGTLEKQTAQTLEATRGVNLDEEAARLIQFQQSYQAAAKVLQVAQKVFDTLLNVSQ